MIDTPGMRTLHLGDFADGIETLFAEITELAPLCKFRDCTHGHEPGCAVRAAVAAGQLDPERLARWRKLVDENRHNTPVRPDRAAPTQPTCAARSADRRKNSNFVLKSGTLAGFAGYT